MSTLTSYCKVVYDVQIIRDDDTVVCNYELEGTNYSVTKEALKLVSDIVGRTRRHHEAIITQKIVPTYR